MTRAILLAFTLTTLVVTACLSYTAGLVESVTYRHTRPETASISR